LVAGAAIESWADFYAAAVDNNKNGSDCKYRDKNCYNDGQYMETNCSTGMSGRGVEGDWTNFWWALHKEEGLSVADINDIYAEAINPDIAGWNASNVYSTLKNSAVNGGYISQGFWIVYALDNGISH